MKRNISAENLARRQPSESSTSIESAGNRSHIIDTPFPKLGRAIKAQRTSLNRSRIKTFMTIGIEEEDDVPEQVGC